MRQPEITRAEMKLAREFENAGLCTISQAVKAFERAEYEKIAVWKKQLAQLQRERENS